MKPRNFYTASKQDPLLPTNSHILLARRLSLGRLFSEGRKPPSRPATAACATAFEVRICTNKVCRRQGSAQLAQLGQDIVQALSNVDVISVGKLANDSDAQTALLLTTSPHHSLHQAGCLGSCGAGPNMAVVPLDGTQPLLLHHISTPARLAEALREVCGAPVGEPGWAA